MAAVPHPPCEPGHGSPEAGFSLVDMLVALTLLAVMAGLMASFVGQFRTISRLQQEAEARAELEAVLAYLQETIGSAMSLPLVHSPVARRTPFEGTASGLQFVAVARQGVQSFGLRETEVALRGEGDTKTLLQIFHPRRLDEGARAAAAVRVELARDIRAIAFSYLSYERTTSEPVWSDEWKNQGRLPAAVRITLTAARAGKGMSVEGEALLKLSERGFTEPAASDGP